jgi:class 3 adenylate cyclase
VGAVAGQPFREEVRRHGGRMLAADLAAFDGPSRALRCGEALRSAQGGGLRAGLHIGECERDGAGLSGPAIDIARRLGELAAPDEILVSRTVVDLVAGSGLRFEPAVRTLGGPLGPIDVLASAAPA